MRARHEREPRPPVEAVVVVVPAHDEEELVTACLTSVAEAAERAGLPTVVVTVLHRCTDGTAERVAEVATSHARPDQTWVSVESDADAVGRVRAEGVEAGLSRVTAYPTESVWIASTDADSRVPAGWLTSQRALADEGVDLVLGTVEPDEAGTPAAQLWHSQHHLVDGHTAIHGANLGVRASAYLRVGGFGERESGEDVDLVHRLRDGDPPAPWTSSDASRVLTSARREGRARRGFARFLRRLDATLADLGDPESVEEALRTEILRRGHELGPTKTQCPSEAAGVVSPDHRQALTHLSRAVACQLADEGLVVITQRGVPVNGRTAPGPVRIRIV